MGMFMSKDESLSGSGLYFDDPDEFVTELPCPAMLKDCTGVYIRSNQKCADLFGMKAEEVSGLTINSLDRKLKNKWEEGYSQHMEKLDYKVISHGEIEKDMDRILPVSAGFLRIQDSTKVPVLTPITKKVSGVITFSYDKTHEYDTLNLYRLYLKTYGNRSTATAVFLKVLKVNVFFNSAPSVREFETIIQIARSYKYLSVSEKLGIKEKTVEKYVASVKEKLISPDLFGALIEMLRQRC